ncbi:MAG: hypothetical protein ACFFKA_16315 [Candidatus Thorarchaeota archaeon]
MPWYVNWLEGEEKTFVTDHSTNGRDFFYKILQMEIFIKNICVLKLIGEFIHGSFLILSLAKPPHPRWGNFSRK